MRAMSATSWAARCAAAAGHDGSRWRRRRGRLAASAQGRACRPAMQSQRPMRRAIMSQAHRSRQEPSSGHAGVPRPILRAGALIAVRDLLARVAADSTGVGAVQTAGERRRSRRLALLFEDRDDGSVAVRDAATTAPDLTSLQPGTNGFIRATRARARARAAADRASAQRRPSALTHWNDGTAVARRLGDRATRRLSTPSEPDNARAFAQLFTERRRKP